MIVLPFRPPTGRPVMKQTEQRDCNEILTSSMDVCGLLDYLTPRTKEPNFSHSISESAILHKQIT